MAQKLINKMIKVWSAGVVNLIHAYDPELIVLSGGVMKLGDTILKPLVRNVRNWAWTPWGQVNFIIPQNPEQSVLLGLHYLVEEMK